MCFFKGKNSQSQIQKVFRSIKSTIIKLILLGHSSVGKTSIKNMYLNNSLFLNHQTTLTNFYESKNMQTKDGSRVQVSIWDKYGSHFMATMPSYYRDANIALIIYDLSNRDSFISIDYWLSDMRQKGQSQRIIKCIVGSKKDLLDNRKVTAQEGKIKASKNNCFYYECSAVSGQGINQLFEILIEQYFTIKPKS